MVDVVIKQEDETGTFAYKTINVISTSVSVLNPALLECVIDETECDKTFIYIPVENIYYCKKSD